MTNSFKDLHVSGDPLILWNIWDAGSAQAIAKAGTKAVATGSASVAGAMGYPDGQAVPLDLLLTICSRIAASVDVPLTVDFESGYAEDAATLTANAARLAQTGAVGLNFEDPEEATAQRLDQALRQIRELVARDKNRPSTVMWCVANEPLGGPPLGGQPVPRAVEAGARFFRRLYDEARRLDATRPVTMVGVQGGVLDWHGIFDVVCVNRYFGWYTQPGRLDEAARLLQERAALARRRDAVELPAHLSTSALVQLAADARRFAVDLRRPLPAPPARAARRGTAFHAWVEGWFATPAMLDLDELPGSADEDGVDGELETMRANFLASPWSARAPVEVERAVETDPFLSEGGRA